MKYTINYNFGGSSSLLCLLQVAFIVLKIMKIIDWSWILVFTPLIIMVVLNLIILIIFYFKYLRW